MPEFIVIVLIAFFSFVGGLISEERTIQDKCVAYYADMPHNKVQQHCKDLLEFKK